MKNPKFDNELVAYVDESGILFPRGSSFAIESRELGADGIVRIVMRQLK